MEVSAIFYIFKSTFFHEDFFIFLTPVFFQTFIAVVNEMTLICYMLLTGILKLFIRASSAIQNIPKIRKIQKSVENYFQGVMTFLIFPVSAVISQNTHLLIVLTVLAAVQVWHLG